jgi:PAS domain S-box-containing protein
MRDEHHEVKGQHNIQEVLGNLLRLSLEDLSLEEVLDRALEEILSVEWLTFQPKGAIFVAEEGVLIMKAQRGLPEEIRQRCSRVRFGSCLCGLTAATKEIQFTDSLHQDHSPPFSGVTPHGHYCVPILYRERVKGVINIYLEEGHRESQRERDFLMAVANTLSGIIQRKDSERAVLESEAKLRAIFNNSPDVLMIVSPSGIIRSANRTTFRLLGYFEETLIGKPFSILLSPSTPLTFEDLTREVRVQKTVLESVEFLRSDGSICPMDMTVNLVPWDEGVMVLVNLRDVTERVMAERAMRRREAILESVRFAAEEFLRPGPWDRNINGILQRIGIASDVSRVYIFKSHTSEDGRLLCSQLFEWVAEGVEPQIDNPELQDFPAEEKGFHRWVDIMQKGEPVYGNIKDFPGAEQEVLKAQDIKSILAMPIFVKDRWWGFMGFDECRQEREWSIIEIDALRTAADILGVAIYRSETEESLKERLNELERFRRATIKREFRIRELQERVRDLETELRRLRDKGGA